MSINSYKRHIITIKVNTFAFRSINHIITIKVNTFAFHSINHIITIKVNTFAFRSIKFAFRSIDLTKLLFSYVTFRY